MENVYQKLDKYRVLETEKLVLRPVTLADAEEMYTYASDEENVRWTFAASQSLEETKNIIASIYLAHPLWEAGVLS